MPKSSRKTAENPATQVNGAAILDEVAATLLCSVLARVERLHEERRLLSADIAAVFQEAKAGGLDIPALRVTLRRRQMDPVYRAELDQITDLYWRVYHGLPIGDDEAVAAPKWRRPPAPVPPHAEARAAGKSDALAGLPINDQRWPPGVYGHADYHLGFYEGERERAEKTLPRQRRPRLGVDFSKIEGAGPRAGSREEAAA